MGLKDDLVDLSYAVSQGMPVDQALKEQHFIGKSYLYQPVNIGVSGLNQKVKAGLEKLYAPQLKDMDPATKLLMEKVYGAAVTAADNLHSRYGNKLAALSSAPSEVPSSPYSKILSAKEVVKGYDNHFADYSKEVLSNFEKETGPDSDLKKALEAKGDADQQIATMKANLEKSLSEQKEAFHKACSEAIDQQAHFEAQYIAQLNVVQMNKYQGKHDDSPLTIEAQQAMLGKMDEKLDQQSIYKAPGGDLAVARNKDNRITEVKFDPNSAANIKAAIQMWQTDPANVNGPLDLKIPKLQHGHHAGANLLGDIMNFVRERNAYKAAMESGVDLNKFTINGQPFKPQPWDILLKNDIKAYEENRAQVKNAAFSQDMTLTDKALGDNKGLDDLVKGLNDKLKNKTGEGLTKAIKEVLDQVENKQGFVDHQIMNIETGFDSSKLSPSEVKEQLSDDKSVATAQSKYSGVLKTVKDALSSLDDKNEDKADLVKRADKATEKNEQSIKDRDELRDKAESKLQADSKTSIQPKK